MTAQRDSILKGVLAAGRLSKELGLEQKALHEWGRVDVYRVAAELDVPVIFRPLKGLLGVFMSEPSPGILVTNQRPPGVQRLTCAHEIGHFYLRHALSVDDEKNIGIALRSGPSTENIELEANGFSYELMMPSTLVRSWARSLLKEGFDARVPSGIYQLSLRLGCSYQATALSLRRLNILSDFQLSAADVPVKSLKQALIPNMDLESWHGDVWCLGERDRKYPIQAAVNDVFVINAPEMASAGYLNEIDDIERNGFQILRESISSSGLATSATGSQGERRSQPIGGAGQWHIALQVKKAIETRLTVESSRPWERSETTKVLMSIPLSVREREAIGLTLEMKQKELEWSLHLGNHSE